MLACRAQRGGVLRCAGRRSRPRLRFVRLAVCGGRRDRLPTVVRLGPCRAAVVALLLAAFAHDLPEARAQNAAAAEALYNKGMAALKSEDFESACPAFEESHRLDPKPGVLFTLAACEQK